MYLPNSSGIILYANKKIEELIGHKKEEMLGKPFMEFTKMNVLELKDIPKAALLFGGALLGRPTGPDEFYFKRPDGSKVPVEVKSFPIMVDNERFVIGAVRDLTTRKYAMRLELEVAERTAEIETQKRKLDEAYGELKSLDELKTKFVQDTAHELKTPLGVMLVAISFLKKKDVVQNEEKYAEMVDLVSRNAQRMRKTIEDTLELYKIEKGRQYEKKETDFDEMVKAVADQFAPIAKEKGLEFRTDIPDLPEMHCDPKAMRTVVENLVENAIKYTDKGRIEVMARADDGMITVSVKDTGIGIPEESQKHIFGRFYRVSAGGSGAGIGLSICKHVVEAHGGTIGFTSSPGKGSTFEFTVPIVHEHKGVSI
ncbi:Methanogenesis regulatory histidine kinase FilI [uncultured archaeon]|nr:Methanogenesis regulatory histidine kinase FilI [uncultured archaeon]